MWKTNHTLKWEGVWRELGCLARTASFSVREESGHSLKSSLSVRLFPDNYFKHIILCHLVPTSDAKGAFCGVFYCSRLLLCLVIQSHPGAPSRKHPFMVDCCVWTAASAAWFFLQGHPLSLFAGLSCCVEDRSSKFPHPTVAVPFLNTRSYTSFWSLVIFNLWLTNCRR